MLLTGYLMKRKFVALGLFLIISALAASPSQAEMRKHQTKMSVTYNGLVVGKATFNINFDDDNYSVSAKGGTSRIVKWITSATGEIKSAGQMIENQLRPNTHSATVKEPKKPEKCVSFLCR